LCILSAIMRRITIGLLGILVGIGALWAQQNAATPPPPKVVAVRAGKLFDPKSGSLLVNQVVVITGDRITDAGPADRVQIPAGAKTVDLSRATVLPGLIDQHLHVMERAQRTPDGKRNPSLVPRVFPNSQAALDSYIDWVLQAAFEAQKDLNA